MKSSFERESSLRSCLQRPASHVPIKVLSSSAVCNSIVPVLYTDLLTPTQEQASFNVNFSGISFSTLVILTRQAFKVIGGQRNVFCVTVADALKDKGILVTRSLRDESLDGNSRH